MSTAHRSALVAAAALLLPACSVAHPSGYEQLSRSAPALGAHATPGQVYGHAPTQWTLEDGREVTIEVERAAVTSGMGLYRADLAFDVAWSNEPSSALRCETSPSGPGVPETRFGCWSQADQGASLRFWMAPDAGCGAVDLEVPATLTTPGCWSGTLTTAVGDDYVIDFARLESTDSPVGRLRWSNAQGQPVLAADLVAELGMELYPATTSPDPLLLQTVALHWWWHASTRTP